MAPRGRGREEAGWDSSPQVLSKVNFPIRQNSRRNVRGLVRFLVCEPSFVNGENEDR